MLLSYHSDPKLKKDTTTIIRASKYLISQGWTVFNSKDDSANGIDLTIARDGRAYHVEIKKVLIGARSCSIKPVTGSGLKCEVIGILLPDDTVLLQPMHEHLKLCSVGGLRSITDLVRLNCRVSTLC